VPQPAKMKIITRVLPEEIDRGIDLIISKIISKEKIKWTIFKHWYIIKELNLANSDFKRILSKYVEI